MKTPLQEMLDRIELDKLEKKYDKEKKKKCAVEVALGGAVKQKLIT